MQKGMYYLKTCVCGGHVFHENMFYGRTLYRNSSEWVLGVGGRWFVAAQNSAPSAAV